MADDPDSEDRWPIPHYNVGDRLHLHALGVISVLFAQFERSLDTHYSNKAREQNLPQELIELYYFSLNEEKRLESIRLIFKRYEKTPEIVDLMYNLIDYYQWCRNCRNQILHAEHYPAAFGGDPDTLYLTKRMGKQSPQQGYMKFKLSTLRLIADKIREGVARSAELHIYLRFRNHPLSSVPAELQVFVRDPLPQTLRVPRHLQLTSNP